MGSGLVRLRASSGLLLRSHIDEYTVQQDVSKVELLLLIQSALHVRPSASPAWPVSWQAWVSLSRKALAISATYFSIPRGSTSEQAAAIYQYGAEYRLDPSRPRASPALAVPGKETRRSVAGRPRISGSRSPFGVALAPGLTLSRPYFSCSSRSLQYFYPVSRSGLLHPWVRGICRFIMQRAPDGDGRLRKRPNARARPRVCPVA
jgi:hypothetical protein